MKHICSKCHCIDFKTIKNIIHNYDYTNIYFKFCLLILSSIIFGIAELLQKYYPKENLLELELWKWFRIISIIPGTYIIGNILDYIIFLLIDIFTYFEGYMTGFTYYINAFRNKIGLFIMVLIITNYYPKITGLIKHREIDKILIIIIIWVSIQLIRNLTVKILLRHKLIYVFTTTINLILLYKNIIYNLSVEDNQSVNKYIYKTNITWKLVKINNSGFKVWDDNKNDYTHIYKKDKMKQFAESSWEKIKNKYLTHNQNHRIHRDNLFKEMNINSDNPYYDNIVHLFDSQDNLMISKTDFVKSILVIFDTWKKSNRHLNGYTNLSIILRIISNTIIYIFMLFLILILYNVSLSSLFVSLATIIVSVSFIVSSFAKDLLNSIILLTFIEPFKIGDRISLPNMRSGSTFIIEDIKVLSSYLRETKTGKIMITSNSKLYSTEIENHTRSDIVIFTLELEIDATTSSDKIASLTHEINQYIIEYPNDWKPELELFVKKINHSNNVVIIEYWIQNYHSWGNTRIYDLKSELYIKVIDIMNQLNIQHKQPLLQIADVDE